MAFPLAILSFLFISDFVFCLPSNGLWLCLPFPLFDYMFFILNIPQPEKSPSYRRIQTRFNSHLNLHCIVYSIFAPKVVECCTCIMHIHYSKTRTKHVFQFWTGACSLNNGKCNRFHLKHPQWINFELFLHI